LVQKEDITMLEDTPTVFNGYFEETDSNVSALPAPDLNVRI
jgi:hypothetical protein